MSWQLPFIDLQWVLSVVAEAIRRLDELLSPVQFLGVVPAFETPGTVVAANIQPHLNLLGRSIWVMLENNPFTMNKAGVRWP